MIAQNFTFSSYPCEPTFISRARADVVQALERTGFTSRLKLMDLEIALGELLQNIVRHESCPAGKATFSIEMSFLGLDLQVQVIDSCEPLADLSFLTKSHQPTENGGMGISLINKIASTYTINAIGKGNIHKLVVNDFLTSS